MYTITDTPAATWDADRLDQMAMEDYPADSQYSTQFSKYNPTPGTGRTGFTKVAPNNYPFYSEEERYVPVMQSDGGQLSEWNPMYNPSKEEAEEHRARAYEAGVPHGYVAPGDKYKGMPAIELWVESEIHQASEYGSQVDAGGRHSGGPFKVQVSPKMRVEELRRVIMAAGGILPALQKLSYAGKHLDDSQRTLEHYGLAYWHAKFPHWPLRIRKY